YRPEPGDRIQMWGRWSIECGHADWHAELHPIEAYVTSHSEEKLDAALGRKVVASVVVTGDWAGGRLELDAWPPPRPNASARLLWRRLDGGREAQLTLQS